MICGGEYCYKFPVSGTIPSSFVSVVRKVYNPWTSPSCSYFSSFNLSNPYFSIDPGKGNWEAANRLIADLKNILGLS